MGGGERLTLKTISVQLQLIQRNFTDFTSERIWSQILKYLKILKLYLLLDMLQKDTIPFFLLLGILSFAT